MRGRPLIALVLIAASAAFVFWLTRPTADLVPPASTDGPPRSGRPLLLTSSSECRACHEEVYDEWRRSHHGIAFTNPEVQKITENFRNFDCLPCHAPEPVLETGLDERVLERRVRLEDGVDCFSCHRHYDAIVGGMHLSGTSDAPCNPMPFAGLSDVGLCKPCHNLHKVVDDWRQSSFAVEGPGKKDCSACHMPPAARAATPGRPAYQGRSHVFPGAHDPEFIRTAASFRAAFAPDGALEIEVRNDGAGHHFPADERHRAVDLTLSVEGADGAATTVRVDRYRNPYRDDFHLKNPLRTPGATREYALDLGRLGAADVRAARIPAAFRPYRKIYFPENTQIDSGEARRYRVLLPEGVARASVRLLYKLHPHVEDDAAALLYETRFDATTPGAGVFGRDGFAVAPPPDAPEAATRKEPVVERVAALFADRTSPLERADAIVGLAAKENQDPLVVPTLRFLMSDSSQAGFMMFDDASAPGGVRIEENPWGGEDVRALERIAACVALERRGGHLALPELLLALDDRDPLVRVHAAKALLALGSRAGVPTWLDALDGKIYENETAERFLREASGEDFGFRSDAGLGARAAAADRWRAWWSAFFATGARLKGEGEPYRRGVDAATDRRIAGYVDLLGGFQFLYMEQARRMLRRLGPESVGFLKDALDEASGPTGATWRGGVAQVLGGVSGDEAAELLRALAKDAHPAVRARAVEASAERRDPGSAAFVRAALDDPDPSVIAAAARGMARVGDRTDAPRLDALATSDAPIEVKVGARTSAYRLHPTPERFEPLAALVFDPSVVVRTAAIDALNAALGRDVVKDPALPEAELRDAVEIWRAAGK